MSERRFEKYAVHISKDNSKVPPQLNSTLEIKALRRSDNGEYECKSSNQFGTKSRKFRVIVEGK